MYAFQRDYEKGREKDILMCFVSQKFHKIRFT